MLGKLHQHGYHHGDFRERKVVVKDGQYKFIDFHDIYEHECDWRDGMDLRTDLLRHEAAAALPCDVLFLVGSNMRLWNYSECFHLPHSATF